MDYPTLVIQRPYTWGYHRIPVDDRLRDGYSARMVGTSAEIRIFRGGEIIRLDPGTFCSRVTLMGERVRFYLCRPDEIPVQAAEDLRGGLKDLIRALPDDWFTNLSTPFDD